MALGPCRRRLAVSGLAALAIVAVGGAGVVPAGSVPSASVAPLSFDRGLSAAPALLVVGPSSGEGSGPPSRPAVIGQPVVRQAHQAATKQRPAITLQPQAVFAAPGSYVRVTAAASGSPRPSVQWELSANQGRRWRTVKGARQRTFLFTALAGQNRDELRAVFANQRGTAATQPVLLTVVSGYAAPTIDAQPANVTAESGASASFSASALALPAATVQWEASSDAGATWANVVGATATTLTFTATASISGEELRAVFTNVLGSATTTVATLSVSGVLGGEPTITLQPQGQSIANGGAVPVTFSAAASGDPTPTVQWQVSLPGGVSWTDIPGATATSYSFAPTQSEDRYEYRAVFTNGEGSATTDPAVLGVFALSSNWSGYFTTGDAPYTNVTASWIVPAVSCPSASTSNSAAWVGIDGADDSTVEQDGTESDCQNGTPYYAAWYEMYGDSASGAANHGNSKTVGSVASGDVITASVSFSSVNSTWTLSVEDQNPDSFGNYSVTIPSPNPPSEQQSAEWIVERPELCDYSTCGLTSLAQFAPVTLTDGQATGHGTTGSIFGLGGEPIEMIRSKTDSTLLAAPGPLSETGDTFTDTWAASN